MKPPDKTLIRILHLEDSELDAELLVRELRRGGIDFVIQRVETQSEFEKALDEFRPDIILADYKLPTYDGAQALKIVRERCPKIPLIIISGSVGEGIAIELLRNGATDIVLKERLRDRLVAALQRAMSEVWNKQARAQVEEEREQLNSELKHLASHDQLTGAASRSLFMEMLQLAINEVAPDTSSALFYIDIDHFKEINAYHGTPFGDQILIETARRLDSLLGSLDLLGNFGGDKFFVLVRQFRSQEEFQGVLEGIKACFEKPFSLRKFSIRVNASIGGVILKDPKTTPLEAMQQTEEAMRLVKSKQVQGFCLVDNKIRTELQRRNEIDQTMASAIESGRMFLVYQPIVDVLAGSVAGAEVLLRCRQKDGSVIPAANFIESLVRTKRMTSVDEWAVSRFMQTELDSGRELLKRDGFRFSFNVSPGLLSIVGYGMQLLAQLGEARMSASSLELEILETDLLPSDTEVITNLNYLRSAGVRIAVDDFGTGYSNLMRLAHLPIDAVKLDRSYLEGIMTKDAKRNSLLSSLVGVANDLGYLIIAEGIEEQPQADYLSTLGCHLMQGYLYAKPMSLVELLDFAERPITTLSKPH